MPELDRGREAGPGCDSRDGRLSQLPQTPVRRAAPTSRCVRLPRLGGAWADRVRPLTINTLVLVVSAQNCELSNTPLMPTLLQVCEDQESGQWMTIHKGLRL